MEIYPDYIHIFTRYGIASIYVEKLKNGVYEFEIGRERIRLIKRGPNDIKIDADEYIIQEGTTFWWVANCGGEEDSAEAEIDEVGEGGDSETEINEIDVGIIDASDSEVFLGPSLLMAYADMWKHVFIILVTDSGVRKIAFDDDLHSLGLKYRYTDESGGNEEVGRISPVVEERDGYKRVCLTCINGFKAAIVVNGHTKDINIITQRGFFTYNYYVYNKGVVELPDIGRIDIAQYL